MTDNVFDEPEECWIGSYFLSALINGDESGLLGSECNQLARWEAATRNGRMGHFATPDGDDSDGHDEFHLCEVTGLMGDCTLVTFWPLKEKVA